MKTRTFYSVTDGGQEIDFNFNTSTFEILEPAYEFYEPKIETPVSDKEIETEIKETYEINYDYMED